MSTFRRRFRPRIPRRRGAATIEQGIGAGNGPPVVPDALPVAPSPGLGPGRLLSALAVLAAAVVAFLVIAPFSHSAPSPNGGLLAPDQPPLEFIYLDSARVDNYLGQVEDGLSKNELRTAQSTREISAGVTGGNVVTVNASQSQQSGTQDTVTPTSADRFYLLLRLLRQEQGSRCIGTSTLTVTQQCLRQTRICAGGVRPHWLTDVSDVANDPSGPGPTMLQRIQCLGVGYFIRLTGVQLFLPSYAQVLPNAQSATALYGADPWPRTAFTSPTQSVNTRAIAAYTSALGDPRMPFMAAPYGGLGAIGQFDVARKTGTIPIFLPADYASLTAEPSLLSGSVTVVGKIVYYATSGASYIDYPTIGEFVPALVGRKRQAFDNEIGVCDTAPPGAALVTSVAEAESQAKRSVSRTTPRHARHRVTRRAVQTARRVFAPDTCRNAAAIRKAVKASVTIKPPFAIVLPLAIYQ